ncbi:hypothetical protein MXAZACID_16604 [Acidocella sp. MX-AZ02]|nr:MULTISPECIES: hypothetical protein [unclassified Acidocella]EKM98215.1 hypothetical protein MXAZACID_16604 [Acidocella sp. MX-AZ02]WBO61041.1 hypothetical protein GT370_10195 [Acidocella sp. MX-AZ03]
MNWIETALSHGRYPDGITKFYAETQLVKAAGDVGEIPPQPVDRLGHHHIKAPDIAAHQPLETDAGESTSAADGIFVMGRQNPALPPDSGGTARSDQ